MAAISSMRRYIAPGKGTSWGALGANDYWVDNGYFYGVGNARTGETAVMEISTGKWTNWTPHVYIDNTTEIRIRGKASLLDTDPHAGYYTRNTVEWDYGRNISRRMRVIEDRIQEWYVFRGNPMGDVLIMPIVTTNDLPPVQYFIEAPNFTVPDDCLSYDTPTATKFVRGDCFGSAEYPVIVDDSFLNVSWSNDGSISNSSSDWIATRESLVATVSNTGTTYNIGARKSGSTYYIYRGFTYFDTSTIPAGSTITYANISLYATAGNQGNASTFLNLTTGQPSFPHLNMIRGDYIYGNYTDRNIGGWSFGTISSVPALINITFRTDKYSTINTTGTGALTKIGVWHHDDIYNFSAISYGSYLTISATEGGASHEPKLYVIYTTGAAAPTAAWSCTPTGGVRNSTRTCTDSSTNTPTSWDWYGTGPLWCTMSNLTNQNPQMFPLNLSYCSLCLIATNAAGSDTECKSNYLWVSQPWVVGG